MRKPPGKGRAAGIGRAGLLLHSARARDQLY
jgi:hypothetical protein